MSGTIFVGDDDAWPVSGWLFRFVVTDLRAVVTSPEAVEVLDTAEAVGTLDLADFPDDDRATVRRALGEPLVEHFGRGVRADVDPAAAIASLRELGEMAARAS